VRQKRSRNVTFITSIFPICLGIGIAIGALIHNIGVGLAIGAGVGTFFNLLAYYLVMSRTEEDNPRHR
jgi:hypothetical protein